MRPPRRRAGCSTDRAMGPEHARSRRQDPMNAVNTEENERQRRCFLHRLYTATGGNYSAARAVDTIASDVGLGTQEGYRIARHLVGCGRLRWRAVGVVSVTPAGAEDVEQESKAE